MLGVTVLIRSRETLETWPYLVIVVGALVVALTRVHPVALLSLAMAASLAGSRNYVNPA